MIKNIRFTKVISVILLISTLITLPGFMVGVSATSRNITEALKEEKEIERIEETEKDETKINTTRDGGVIVSSFFDYRLYEDRFIEDETQKDKSKSNSDVNIIPTRTNVDMSTYLRRYKYNNDTRYGKVNLTTGDLEIEYNLANIKGNNGEDLRLDIRYSAQDSNIYEATWGTLSDGHEGYYVTRADKIYRLDNNVYVLLYTELTTRVFTTTSEQAAYIQEINSIPDSYYTDMGESYKHCVDVYNMGVTYLPEVDFVLKEGNAKRNGLGYGWTYSIPNIEVQYYIDVNTGVRDYSYQVLTLENGRRYNLEDYEFTYLQKNDITIEEYTETVNNVTCSHKVTLKDGETYYFTSEGLCVRKADRYGNGINYEYVGTGLNAKLSTMSDDYGREINISYVGREIIVSSDDSIEVSLSLEDDQMINRDLLVGITYNDVESYEIIYDELDGYCEITEYDVGFGSETYYMITDIVHPNGDINEYTYDFVVVPWGNEGGVKSIPMVVESVDIIDNNEVNEITYTRTGNSYDTNKQRMNNVSDFNYTVTVEKDSKTRVYTYNVKDLLVSDSYGYQITEYRYTNNLPTRITNRDYGSNTIGNHVSSEETYTYDNKGNILSYTDALGISTTYIYDNTYNIRTKETRNGVVIQYTLSQNHKNVIGKEIKKINTVYDKETYTYDNKGNILSKTKYIYPGGTNTIVTNYSYTDNVINRPISLTGLYNTGISVSNTTYTTSTKYDIAGRVISEIDGNGNETSYTYDNLGRLTRKDYEDGTYETWTYNLSENSITERNRDGYIIKTIYDLYDNEISIYEINGNTETLLKENEYDTNYRLIKETDAYGNYVTYTYDERDRITSKKIYTSSDVLKGEEIYTYIVSNGCLKNKVENGNTVSIEYINDKGQLIKKGGKKGNQEILVEYTYDNDNNVITAKDPKGNITSYTYDVFGNVLTITNALNNVVTKTYNNLGNVLSEQDALNHINTYIYDNLGRKTKETLYVDGSTYKGEITYSYDNNGNVLEVKKKDNAPGQTTTYQKTVNEYDSNNNVISTKMYNGTSIETEIEYTYSPYGKVLTKTVGDVDEETNVYNVRGELISSTDALNHSETYTYNLLGQVTSKTDRNGSTYTYTYDVFGNVTSETITRGNNSPIVTTYMFNESNMLVYMNNGSTCITREYDELLRMTKEIDNDGVDVHINEYEYDNNGNRIRYIEKLNGTKVREEYYTYNSVNELISIGYYDYIEQGLTPPDPGPDPEPEYDPNSIIDVNGNQVFTYSSTYASGSYGIGIYNQNNVQTGTVYITPTNNQTYVNIQGSLIQDTNGEYVGGTITFTDVNETRTYYFSDFATGNVDGSIEEGILIGYYITDVDGYRAYTVFVDEDPFSNDYCAWITSIIYDGSTYNGGMRNTFNQEDGRARNRDNNLVWQDAGIYVTYTYDNNGNVISASYNNGTSTIYTYTEGNLVKSVENKKGNIVLSSYAYTYYLSGNVKTIIENGNITKTYVYDHLGMLTSETIVEGNTTDSYLYEYDERGNRTKLTQNGVITTYSYDLNNRLVGEVSGLSVKVYSYDNNGNTLSVLVNGNIINGYTYDIGSRQVSYTSDNIGYTYYTYRGDGLRHSKGSLKQYWDGENISLEKNGNDIIEYYRGITLIFKDDGNTKTYYLYNGHLDVVNLTDESGNKTKTYEYDAFGVEIDIDSYDTNAFRYCGEYYDKESKNIYLRARYYTSTTGRFTQEDPIKDGYNWYVYCNNNPVNLVDPSGLKFIYIDIDGNNVDVSNDNYKIDQENLTNNDESNFIIRIWSIIVDFFKNIFSKNKTQDDKEKDYDSFRENLINKINDNLYAFIDTSLDNFKETITDEYIDMIINQFGSLENANKILNSSNLFNNDNMKTALVQLIVDEAREMYNNNTYGKNPNSLVNNITGKAEFLISCQYVDEEVHRILNSDRPLTVKDIKAIEESVFTVSLLKVRFDGNIMTPKQAKDFIFILMNLCQQS